MASTRQLKHHARFHAAVLRHFFPSSSPPSNTNKGAAHFSEKVSFQIESPESTQQVSEQTHTDNKNGEVEAGTALLSRAQRKRLKMKKMKERQSNALHTMRFVGPLLPGSLEKRRLGALRQDEAADFSEEVSFQIESPESTEQVSEETHTDNKKGAVEAGKALLSRAQRKRLKMKIVKERQSNALHTMRFVGPLLSDSLEKGRLENDEWEPGGALLQENVTIEKSSISPSVRDEGLFEDIGKSEVLSSTAGEELAMAKTVEATTGEEVAMAKVEEATPSLLETGEKLAMAKTEEATSSLLETGEELPMLKTEETTTSFPEPGEGKIMHDSVELEISSKVKRRRLAKKKFHDGIRQSTAGSSFIAEIKGGDIFIKQVS